MTEIRAQAPRRSALLAADEFDAQHWIDHRPELIEVQWFTPDEVLASSPPDARRVAVTQAVKDHPRFAEALERLKLSVVNGFFAPVTKTEWEIGS